MKPNPPSWIMRRITAWPKKDQVVAVSTVTSPVTQVAEVAVKKALKSPALSPLRAAMGRDSRRVPTKMITAKEPATNRVALRLRKRIKWSRIKREKCSSKACPPFRTIRAKAYRRQACRYASEYQRGRMVGISAAHLTLSNFCSRLLILPSPFVCLPLTCS